MAKKENIPSKNKETEIIEVQNNYYLIIPPDATSRFFWSQQQGIERVIEFFYNKCISAEGVVTLTGAILELPIQFMWHPKDRTPEEREGVECDQKLSLAMRISEIGITQQVLLTGKPAIVVRESKDTQVQGFILTRRYISEPFYNFNEGNKEIEKALLKGCIKIQDCPVLREKIIDLFGDSPLQNGEFTFGLT